MSEVGLITVPLNTRALVEKLESAGYETWCVGGAVRDALRGESPNDFDLATAARPEQVRRLFKRTIPIGIEHGTVGVLDPDGILHEVTTFRQDVTTDGRHAVVAFGVSLEADLARRDFTLNAIAWQPTRRELRDPFNGVADLHSGIIRAVGIPADRFREDRLRILRAIRFAARFQFEIDPPTWEAILVQGSDTGHLSAERVRDEWIKSLLTTDDLPRLVRLWHESGVSSVWMPELKTQGLLPGRFRGLARDPVILTALLTGHSAAVWRRLKGSNQEIRRAELIDRGPQTPADSHPLAVRCWMSRVGAAVDDLLALADWRAASSGIDPADWVDTVGGVRQRGEATSRSDLALSGDDLIRERVVAPGPAMGQILDDLLALVLEQPELNTRDQLLARARELA